MNTPSISVLITAWNREQYIGEAIDSILASDFQDFEVIVVDDMSEDKTVDIAAKYAKIDPRIRVYVNEQNLGDYPNRNKAASYARGKYIKYLDSDDILYKHCLGLMFESIEQFPEAGFGLCCVPDPKASFPIFLQPRQAYQEHFSGQGHFNRAPGSAIIKREAFESVGGFSGKRMIGDYELWLKLGRVYPLVKMVTGLYWDRHHGNQERFSDYAKKNYESLRHSVMLEAFASKDCPLNEEEKLEILRLEKRRLYEFRIKSKIHELKGIFKKSQSKQD